MVKQSNSFLKIEFNNINIEKLIKEIKILKK